LTLPFPPRVNFSAYPRMASFAPLSSNPRRLPVSHLLRRRLDFRLPALHLTNDSFTFPGDLRQMEECSPPSYLIRELPSQPPLVFSFLTPARQTPCFFFLFCADGTVFRLRRRPPFVLPQGRHLLQSLYFSFFLTGRRRLFQDLGGPRRARLLANDSSGHYFPSKDRSTRVPSSRTRTTSSSVATVLGSRSDFECSQGANDTPTLSTQPHRFECDVTCGQSTGFPPCLKRD